MKCSIVSLIARDYNKIPERNVILLSSLLDRFRNEDLIMFPGWTLASKSDLCFLLETIANQHTTFVLEIGSGYETRNYPRSDEGFYIIKGKSIIKGPIKQLFKNSAEANSNENNLILNYLNKLEKERLFEVNNKNVRLIICGENNILLNRQKDKNKVDGLRSDDKELKNKFASILENTDVFLNPAHTPMGNLGKLKKRWAYLSKDSRTCLFTTNQKNIIDLHKSSLQYIFINGKEKKASEEVCDKFKISSFEIK